MGKCRMIRKPLMQTITRQFRFVTAGFFVLACAQCVSGATWKFLAYGDSRAASGSGVNTNILAELATQTLVENPEFVLFPGDLVGTGGQTVYNTWMSTMQPVYDAGIGVCPVAGNHEANGGQSALNAFKSTFITPYTTAPFAGMTNLVVDTSPFDGRSYAFNFNTALFLCMDNYSNASTSAHCVNQTFLDAQLAARNPATTPLVFATWHEPAFKAGQDTGLEANPARRNATWTSLQNTGCRQVFNGHDHLYATARLDNGDGNPNNDTYQVVVGTAGAPFYAVAYSGDTGSWTVVPISSEANSYGYVRVVVDDEAQTVVQTWVHRTAPNTFVDTTNVVSYTYGATWTNSASSFRITGCILTGSDLLITWVTGVGKTNALQATGGDSSGSYSTNNFGDIFIVTNTVGTTTNYLDLGAATNAPARYYRVRLVP